VIFRAGALPRDWIKSLTSGRQLDGTNWRVSSAPSLAWDTIRWLLLHLNNATICHLFTTYTAPYAWDRGDLILKATPNDPEAPKRALIGWFVRLHSMCFKGEKFRGFDELEREVMGQLSTELKLRSLGSTLSRMILVNIAAQHISIENYKGNHYE
jgi:hypothetical protein